MLIDKVANVEGTTADRLETSQCDATDEYYADGGEPTPTRNLRRLRKHTLESKAAVAKDHAIDVVVEVKDSDTEDSGNLAPSENIKVQQVLKDISNGVVESKAKATKGIRKSSDSDDGQKLGQCRRSKCLLCRQTRLQDMDAVDFKEDI